MASIDLELQKGQQQKKSNAKMSSIEIDSETIKFVRGFFLFYFGVFLGHILHKCKG